MTKDKYILENLEFLDKVLNYLIHECSEYSSSFDNLYFHFYNRNLEDDNFNVAGHYNSILISESADLNDILENFSVCDNIKAEGQKLVEACLYLKHENLIFLNYRFDIKITFQGIVKHSNNFLSTYNLKTLNDQRLQNVEASQNFHLKWMTFLTGLLAIGALIAMIYYILEILKIFRGCIF